MGMWNMSKQNFVYRNFLYTEFGNNGIIIVADYYIRDIKTQ